MKESVFQSQFGKWVRSDLARARSMFGDCAAFELKVERGGTFNRKKIQAHQFEGLALAAGNGLFHKISDSPIFKGMKTRFTAPKCFDCLLMSNASVWIVIAFYKKGQSIKERTVVAVRPADLLSHPTGSIKKTEMEEMGKTFNCWEV